jgi:uncharacterized membrane protein YkvA (DUF1232 family)
MRCASAEIGVGSAGCAKLSTVCLVRDEMNLLRFALTLRRVGAASLAALVDRRVPARLKVIAVVAALFIVSPLNILGDLPLLGIIDDAALLALVLTWFTRVSKPYLSTIDS